MINGLVIKTAKTKDDAAALGKIAKEIWTEHYTPIIGADQVNYMLDKFQSAEKMYGDFTLRGYTYYMPIINGRLAGYACAKPDEDGKSLFLSKLYVHSDFRRKGLAKALIGRLKSDFTGCKTIWLTVNKNNPNSIAAYVKLGFKKVRNLETDIGGGFFMDDYRMELSI